MTRKSSIALCALALLSSASLGCSRSETPPPSDTGQSPAAMREKDMAEARQAIEGMLEGVRDELARKSAASGKPVDPPAPPP
jgi:hypothetical protein